MSKQPISTFLGIAAAAVLVSSSYAADIFVPGGEPTIQAGIDAAVDGDVVIVAQGEYFEHIIFNGKAITVRSTDPNDAGVVLNTIINGGGSGPVVRCHRGEGSDTVLSGFVITGGNSNSGGGMNNISSSPTVTNCTFSGNSAKFNGGAMNNIGISPIGSSPTVTNCSFIGNSAGSAGGGMYDINGSSPTVTSCSFSGNSAGIGGGMFNINSSSPTVTNCTFSGNTANVNGGGMYNWGTNPMVTSCTFSANTATDSGGGMYNNGSSPTVTNCSFSANTATDSGGGMRNVGISNPTVANTGFCDNTPDQISGTFTDDGGNSLLYCAPPIPKPNPCPTDINDDGVTNVLDLIDVLLAFGQACP